MGKQGSPRSPRPMSQNSNNSSLFRMKDYHIIRSSSDSLGASGIDPSIGRRILGGENYWNSKLVLLHGLKDDSGKLITPCKGVYGGKRHTWFRRNVKSLAFLFLLMAFFFLLDSLMVSIFGSMNLHSSSTTTNSRDPEAKGEGLGYVHEERPTVQMYGRLLNLASSALAEKEFKQDSLNYWKEPYPQASKWKPCADRKTPTSLGKPEKSNGYIMVSANGGLNQQRVAICNAVAVASLLNATLVLPKFLYSNVWKDPSQFGDIYQEDYFMRILKDDIDIVKELPPHLKALDIEAIGSLITDSDIEKEAKPDDYVRSVLPILLQNRVVHFLGFGNRLGFDPLPPDLQKLRCKCNFHALKFVPKIQEVGSLLIKRIRKHYAAKRQLDKQLLGSFLPSISSKEHNAAKGPSKYLALHLRFEEDMVAYSLCDFGGGKHEKRELQAYREVHFPLLIERLKTSKPVSPAELRKLGRCPLTPEEAALVLGALGFKRETYIYLAGSHIYGGSSRMQPFTSLYPNLVTKETLLTPSELAPFRNFSSQLAALDFIACATSDVFAMTDSGSQLSSLVSGFRTYYGDGQAPTLRPNKKRLAAILSENSTIEWNVFEDRVRKMIEEGQRVRVRGSGRSIYRQPRCPECMCRSQ
ncbi:GDP-fucose protein O-fucosyltransferase [Corchorus olitorius]|uniref:O-fucosyltransferase family protein n=1 Tax=Corchorus olitorius TaxID=93759 RepID=A0A1R3H555_9ROSI|nr:GDP-fucose protein O-fucosyltransferase [Corchorus olitorius]